MILLVDMVGYYGGGGWIKVKRKRAETSGASVVTNKSPPITMRSIFMRLSDHFIGARGKKYVAKIYMAEKIRNSGNVGPFILRSVGVGSLRDSWWYTQRPRQQGRVQFST